MSGNEKVYTAIATAAFGLEGVVAGELKRLGMREVRGEQGGARFRATPAELFLCNLRLRCADRVLMVLSEAECRSFEELPQEAQDYVAFVEDLAHTRVTFVGVGAGREQIINRFWK